MISSSILVADDHAHIRHLVQQSLRRGGYEHFSFASNGLEALLVAQNAAPDIIILDFDMPKLDGLAALAELRSHPFTAAVPVIMMSGCAEFHAGIDARSFGADQVLAKPFAPSFLLESVNRMLSRGSCIATRAPEGLGAGWPPHRL
jgi:DNA-binding response OmpR family regulator